MQKKLLSHGITNGIMLVPVEVIIEITQTLYSKITDSDFHRTRWRLTVYSIISQ